MELVNDFKDMLAKWNDYKGTCGRRQFWMTVLSVAIVEIVAMILNVIPFIGPILVNLINVALSFIMMSLLARRLRDAGYPYQLCYVAIISIVSGVMSILTIIAPFLAAALALIFFLLGIVYFLAGVLAIVVIVFCCMPTKGQAKEEAKSEEAKSEEPKQE